MTDHRLRRCAHAKADPVRVRQRSYQRVEPASAVAESLFFQRRRVACEHGAQQFEVVALRRDRHYRVGRALALFQQRALQLFDHREVRALQRATRTSWAIGDRHDHIVA